MSACDVSAANMRQVQWERLEMCDMSRASEFSTNVWQGPTPDHILRPGSCEPILEDFDLFIEASDLASIPGPRLLAKLNKQLDDGPQRMEFPSSGSILIPSSENREVDDLVNTVRWIYYLANPDGPDHHPDADGDIPMLPLSKKSRKILIHCPDGYTESSLLMLAYVMFSEGIPAHDAWLKLHREKKRNFFAYPSDVTFLTTVQGRLLQESPAAHAHGITSFPDPPWFKYCDGSLPSRILPYMYLGNLSHANNPEMLWELGIRRILSIGESVSWNSSEISKMGPENILHITQVQDNGIDPLTQEFDRCLDFIRMFTPPRWLLVVCLASCLPNLQAKVNMMGRLRWCTAALAYHDQQQSASPKSWRPMGFRSPELSMSKCIPNN
jgi:dual specificity MAP kinase phosphatase